LYYTASGIVTPGGGRPVCRLGEDSLNKFLFHNKFIIHLYMFRALCAHRQGMNIVLYSIWYRHTSSWPSGVQVGRGYQMLYNTILTS